jgi:hypothetical protein
MTRFVGFAFAGLLVGLAPAGANAHGIVNVCSTDTAPGGTNLEQALASGGIIYIQCPGGSPIRVTKTHRVPPNTMIHGNGTAVLDGTGFRGRFLEAAGAITIKRITLRHFEGFRFRPAEPGFISLGRIGASILESEKQITLENVTVEHSVNPIIGNGPLSALGVRFVDNSGIALSVKGPLRLDQSVFLRNEVALSLIEGRVLRTTFLDNKAGAVRIRHPKNQVELRDIEISRSSGRAGLEITQRTAPEGAEPVLIRNARFRDNRAGAIRIYDSAQGARDPRVRAIISRYPPGAFRIQYSHFVGNSGVDAGGALRLDLANTRFLHVTAGRFQENVAGLRGGAVAVTGGSVQIDHSLFQANVSPRGMGLDAEAGSDVTIANSLFVRHAGPAAAVQIARGRLVNVTIADNGGAGLVATRAGVAVANSILANNRGGNCRNLGTLSPGNIQFGASDCLGAAVQDPFLDRMYAPMAGSPALESGDAAVCRAPPVSSRDLAFQPRSLGATCTAGAFEKSPVRLARVPRERRDRPDRPTVRVPGLGDIPRQLVDITPGGRWATPARHALLEAFGRSEQASSSHAELSYVRGSTGFAQTMEKAGGDRLYYRSAGSGGTFETVRVGDTTLWRVDGGVWTSAPTPPAADASKRFSAAEILRAGVKAVDDVGVRRVGGRTERVLSAVLEWSNGDEHSRGVLTVTIGRESRLVTEMLFVGQCAATLCRFHQTLVYGPVAIELPR